MKLLFENWRRFIKEDIGYFGDKFVQFKSMVEAGKHPLLVAQLYLEYIGKGSTRKVFGFPDNKTHLLKVINVELSVGEEIYDEDYVNPFTGFTRKHKTVSNENEADLKMQQRHPHVFPRTYEVADDYSWILVERVEPLSDDELADYLGIPREVTHLENRRMYLIMLDLIIEQIQKGMNENIEDTAVMPPRAPATSFPGFTNPPPTEEEEPTQTQGLTLEVLQDSAQHILRDSHNRKLFRAVIDLGIPPRELLAKNLGISKFGGDHLVILDASLWEFEKQPPATSEPSEETYNL